MVRLIRMLLFLTLLVGGCAQAQSFVWRVMGDGNTVYLAGSMHLLPERAYPLPQAYETAYSDSGMLVVEADQRDLNSENARQGMLAAARYRQGTLADHLDAATVKRTRAVLQANSLSMDDLNAYRPWFVAMTIEIQAYQAQGFRPDLSLDSYFQNRAVVDRKAILPLQSIAAHLAIFTQMPTALSRDQLAVTLDNADELDSAPGEIYREWRSGDIDEFSQSIIEQARAYPALYDRLIFDRNTAWLDTMRVLLHSPRNAMVLVGAAHLVGEGGVIDELRQQGYRVQRME